MGQFKFGNIKQLQRDREVEGTTGTQIHLRGGICITALCASDANPAWKKFGEDFLAELKRLSRANASDERVKEYLAAELTRLMVRNIEGVVDEDGNAIPFSPEMSRQFLKEADDAIPALQNIVYDTQNFRGQRIEAIVESAKN